MATTKFQMQGKVIATGSLMSWLSDTPDWAGALAEDFVGNHVPVTDVALAGGGFETFGSVPAGAMTFDDGSYVVFDDGSYAVTV